MAINKICTSLEQSHKLVELGIDIDTADMGWNVFVDNTIRLLPINDWNLVKDGSGNVKFYPAWSLTALLELIPNYVINKADDKTYANLYYGLKSSHDNLVDAAFEMVCQMKENEKL